MSEHKRLALSHDENWWITLCACGETIVGLDQWGEHKRLRNAKQTRETHMSEITAEEVYEKAASGLIEEFGNLLTYLYRDKSLFPPRMDELVGGGMDWVSPETEQSWLRWLACARTFDHLEWQRVWDHAPGGAPGDVAIPGVTESVARVAAGVYEGVEAGLREFDKTYKSIHENEGLFWFYADTQLAAALTAEAAGSPGLDDGEPGLGERG